LSRTYVTHSRDIGPKGGRRFDHKSLHSGEGGERRLEIVGLDDGYPLFENREEWGNQAAEWIPSQHFGSASDLN
jgi:hypothetical protein